MSTFSGGFVGVDVFFVISGYLITSIIVRDQKKGAFSVSNFYMRRLRRILPALFLVTFLTIPFAWLWMLPDDLDSFARSVLSIPYFVSNIFSGAKSAISIQMQISSLCCTLGALL
ncbi:hypothetical protein C0029_17440 [Halioglobus japonicus]|uniref:Acyltransferase 3 domain-containing protein n=1 Tax=Halioglobus japonicus TaxID=930805 RepID=A0AAP8MBV7_9GAMM|nr:hypothetical protein C0029_17440 [Halioglobus japonicus]